MFLFFVIACVHNLQEVIILLIKFSNFRPLLSSQRSLSSGDVVVASEIVYTMAYTQQYFMLLALKTQNIYSFSLFLHENLFCRMNVAMQGGQTLPPGMQGTTNSSHMSGSSQLMSGFPLKNSQPYSPSR
jgi:hypothetical protein